MEYLNLNLNERQKILLRSVDHLDQEDQDIYYQISSWFDFNMLAITFINIILSGLSRAFLPIWYEYFGLIYLVDCLYEIFISKKPNKETIESRLFWSVTAIVSIVTLYCLPYLSVPFFLIAFSRDLIRTVQSVYQDLHDCDNLIAKLKLKLYSNDFFEGDKKTLINKIFQLQKKRSEIKLEGIINITVTTLLFASIGIVLITISAFIPVLPAALIVASGAVALGALILPPLWTLIKKIFTHNPDIKSEIELQPITIGNENILAKPNTNQITKPAFNSTNAKLFKSGLIHTIPLYEPCNHHFTNIHKLITKIPETPETSLSTHFHVPALSMGNKK